MHPVLELRRTLLDAQSLSGTVISIAGQTAVIRTRRGSQSLSIPVGMNLSSGDRVRIEGNNITGKLKAESDLPIFQT